MDSVTLIRVVAGIVAIVLVGIMVARRRRMEPNKH
jgi:hypothetical protein